MYRITCLFLLLAFVSFGQASQRVPSALPGTCTMTLNVTVLVSGVPHTYFLSFGGPCATLSRMWRRIVVEFLGPFLDAVLAMFPGQQPQIVCWWISWG
ncbi:MULTISPECIES: hypothetical protein [unclassified Flavobacterium]|uniref:hypothetical protein n=1 Tax=unclassified Flavobacterium TaxID=196869 RepID=UPI001F130095|nr:MULTISPECIES: hypothetical protein [unclassified Flavobacterium]UMY66079.1 hypothetical protein MKO97_01490 [Flavobacterium sp. HJ-32-4]